MGEWSSYRIRDFLLFSRDILFEVYESYNLDYWPWQLLWLLASLLILLLLAKPDPKRLRFLLALLAFAWAWVGYVFHLKYFVPINWAAKSFALLFFAQGGLLIMVGVLMRDLGLVARSSWRYRVGLLLYLSAVLIPIELFFGMPVTQILPFGWGAERTALGTLGLVFLLKPMKAILLLAPIPLLWSLLSTVVLASLR